MKWDKHIKYTLKKCNSRLYALRVLRPVVAAPALMQAYQGIILSIIDYGSALFVSLPKHLQDQLNVFTKRCHRIIHGSDCKCNILENVNSRRLRMACNLYKLAEITPEHPLHKLIPKKLTRTGCYSVEFTKTLRRQSQFQVYLSILLNDLGLLDKNNIFFSLTYFRPLFPFSATSLFVTFKHV